jgi:hypothetical protein
MSSLQGDPAGLALLAARVSGATSDVVPSAVHTG